VRSPWAAACHLNGTCAEDLQRGMCPPGRARVHLARPRIYYTGCKQRHWSWADRPAASARLPHGTTQITATLPVPEERRRSNIYFGIRVDGVAAYSLYFVAAGLNWNSKMLGGTKWKARGHFLRPRVAHTTPTCLDAPRDVATRHDPHLNRNGRATQARCTRRAGRARCRSTCPPPAQSQSSRSNTTTGATGPSE
jgi:hypothetical protein